MQNPFESAARSEGKRRAIEEGLTGTRRGRLAGFELPLIRVINTVNLETDYYSAPNSVIDILRARAKDGTLSDVLELLDQEEIKKLMAILTMDSSIDSADQQLPTEFWTHPRIRSSVKKIAEDYLKVGSYMPFAEDYYTQSAAQYIRLGEIEIAEIQEAATSGFYNAFRNRDTQNALALYKDLKGIGQSLKLSRKDIADAYVGFISHESLNDIKNVKEITHVPPAAFEAAKVAMDSVYKKLFDEYRGQQHDLSEFNERISGLAKASEIGPDWQGRLRPHVEQALLFALGAGGKFDIFEAKDIIDMTGVSISLEAQQKPVIQKEYAKVLQNGMSIEDLDELGKAIDAKPDFSGELKTEVASHYQEIVDKKDGLWSGRHLNILSVANAYFEWIQQDMHPPLSRVEEGDLFRAHDIRKLRQQTGTAGFRKALEYESVRNFVTANVASPKMGQFFVPELFGPDLDTWLEKPEAKVFLGPAIVESFKKGDLEHTKKLVQAAGSDFLSYLGSNEAVSGIDEALNQNWSDVTWTITLIRQAVGSLAGDAGSKGLKIVNDYIARSILKQTKAVSERGDLSDVGYYISLSRSNNVELPKRAILEYALQGVLRNVMFVDRAPGNLMRLKEKLRELKIIDKEEIAKQGDGQGSEWTDFAGALGLPEERLKDEAEQVFRQEFATNIDGDPEIFKDAIENFPSLRVLVPEMRKPIKELFPQMIANGQIDRLNAWCHLLKITPERFSTAEDFVKSAGRILSSPRSLAILFQYLLPIGKEREKAVEWLRSQVGWVGALPELVVLAGPAANKKFCPYEQHLQPLLQGLHFVHFEAADREALVEYVRHFHMLNVPGLFKTVRALVYARRMVASKTEAVVDASEVERMDLFLRVHEKGAWESPKKVKDIDQILEKLQEAIRTMRKDLIEDRTPAALEASPLHMELFNAMIPVSGGYGSYADRKERIAKWRTTVFNLEKSGLADQSRLPDGYMPQRFQVRAKTKRGSLAEIFQGTQSEETSEEEKVVFFKKKVQASIEKEQVKEPFLVYIRPFNGALLEASSDPKDPRSVEGIFVCLEARYMDVVVEREEALEKAKAEGNEKKILGVQIALKKAESQLEMARKAQGLYKEKEKMWLGNSTGQSRWAKNAFEAMAETYGKDVNQIGGSELARLGMLIAEERAPQHVQAIREALRQKPADQLMTNELREAWFKWFEEELLEHLTNPAEEIVSPQAMTALQALFRVDKIRERLLREPEKGEKAPTHGLNDVRLNIRKLEAGLRSMESAASGELIEIGFYPVHGLGRIFASDLANACYNKLNFALAENKYPKVQADLIVSEAENRLDILGSTLWIEASDTEGRKAIVIRALNPRDEVVNNELNSDDLVEAVVKRGISLAQARGLDEVRMGHDHKGGHATNRELIFKAESEMIKKRNLAKTNTNLENIPETNFNGYAIWKAEESYLVWTKEKGRL